LPLFPYEVCVGDNQHDEHDEPKDKGNDRSGKKKEETFSIFAAADRGARASNSKPMRRGDIFETKINPEEKKKQNRGTLDDQRMHSRRLTRGNINRKVGNKAKSLSLSLSRPKKKYQVKFAHRLAHQPAILMQQ